MDANKQADHVLDRAIDLARHLRTGDHQQALKAITALRGTCDWLAVELWGKLVTPQEIISEHDTVLSEVVHG